MFTKALHHFLGIWSVAISYCDNTHMDRGKPDRECSSRVFYQNSDESFERSIYGTMNNNGCFYLAILIDIIATKTARQLEIKLKYFNMSLYIKYCFQQKHT